MEQGTESLAANGRPRSPAPPPAGRPRRGWGGVGGVGGVRQLSPGPASQGPNELAASWAPATADTALVSAETKPLTEKLLPSAKGVVATSRRLAHTAPTAARRMPHMPIPSRF